MPKETKKGKKKERLVLLDAHAILHRAYHALPDFTAPNGDPTGALYGVAAMLLKIVTELKPDYIVACYDLPEPTYRHEVYKEYKAGRSKTDESLVSQIDRSRDLFEAFNIPIYEHPGFEADDMLGTIVEQTKDDKNLEVIIASGDMDTLQLVDKKKVQVYTLRKGIKDTITYDEKGVKERFSFGPKLLPDYKGLRGDPSDNIIGIPGIGEKTATELIVNFGTIEKMYQTLKKDETAFEKAGIKPRIVGLLRDNEEEALFSKMLATIRRDAPVTFTLPKNTWGDALDVSVVLSLFSELGFRTLSGRVRSLFGAPEEEEVKEEEVVDPEEAHKAAIALWVLNSEMTNATPEEVLQYGKDVYKTQTFKDTYAEILKRLKKEGGDSIYTDIELPLIPILEKMHEHGVLIDHVYLENLSKEYHKELSKIEKSIYKHAGSEFNINSPRQLGKVLFDDMELVVKNQKRTSTGQKSTRESELEKMRDQHEIIGQILAYRELQKLLSTYIDNLPHMLDKKHRLHATLLQHGTTTGRMSSQNPNIQNIPIRSEHGIKVRNAFIASRGYDLVALDYSQIELRVASILSEDKKLTKVFKDGGDVHQAVASEVFAVAPEEVTPDMRRRAKVINFGIIYGMGVNALRQNLGADTTGRKEAQEFYDAYFNQFGGLADYLEDTKHFATKNGYTETLFGRRRYFSGLSSPLPYIRAQAERMAINAPVQGTAADVIKIAMIRIAAYLKEQKETDAHMLMQVHDELVFEIKKDKTKEVTKEIKKIMESVLTEKQSGGVPLNVDAKAGKNWGEMKSL